MPKGRARATKPPKKEIELEVEIEYVDIRDLSPDRREAYEEMQRLLERSFRRADRKALARLQRKYKDANIGPELLENKSLAK